MGQSTLQAKSSAGHLIQAMPTTNSISHHTPNKGKKGLTARATTSATQERSFNGPGTSPRCTPSHSLCQGEWHCHGPKEPVASQGFTGGRVHSLHCSHRWLFFFFPSEPEMSGLIADSLFHSGCTVIGQGEQVKMPPLRGIRSLKCHGSILGSQLEIPATASCSLC